MADYTSKNIKNICIAGHGTSGKTTLAESLMFDAGVINRLGTVESKNTISDFTEEETNRGISISTSVCSVEYKNQLISFMDTPGYFDFEGEVASSIPFAETVLLTVKGTTGLDVGTEKSYRTAHKLGKSIAFFVNEIDKENVNVSEVISGIESDLGIFVAPVTYPAEIGPNTNSIIDIINGKLLKYTNGKRTAEEEIPANLADTVAELKEKLTETVAESDEALMEKYLEEGELSAEEVKTGLAKAFAEGTIFPIFFGAPNKSIGTDVILESAADFFPSPADKPLHFEGGETIEADASQPAKAIVFKVNTIPQFGEVYIFRLLQGEIPESSDVFNATVSGNEKLGQIFYLRGKERTALKKAVAGQIVATVKLKNTKTGDQIVADKNIDPYKFDLIKWPVAIVRGAFTGASKEDTDKVATALKRMQVEDASFRFHSDAELKQLMVDGLGELHLEVIAKKIKNQFGISVKIEEPRIPYRETIKGSAEVRYRHKKQSGGAGEFAEVNIVVEPCESEFEFVDAIVGGVVSNRFIPAVEKGVKEIMVEGVISGCKFINCRVTLNDGKEHPVDSKEVAFKKAAAMAFREAIKKAKPILLEPIYDVAIKVPEEYAGSVMGDISSRRGRPLGMDSEGKYTVVKAKVPLKELHGYSTQLRSMTNGRGTYTIAFSNYDQVASDIQQKIVEEYEKSREA